MSEGRIIDIDIAARFGLGPKAGQLMHELVYLIVETPDELRGFIGKFRSAGLDSEVASWLGRSDGAALTGPQVERALGNTALGGIASRVGLGSGVVATAIGYILPKLIGSITPGGVIPAGIPAALSGFVQETLIQGRTGAVGPAAPPATGLTEAGLAGSAAGEGDVTKDAEGPADIEGSALAEIEAILARLDRGIAAEHVAMDGLLERISSRLPHDSRTPR